MNIFQLNCGDLIKRGNSIAIFLKQLNYEEIFSFRAVSDVYASIAVEPILSISITFKHSPDLFRYYYTSLTFRKIFHTDHDIKEFIFLKVLLIDKTENIFVFHKDFLQNLEILERINWDIV